MAYGARKVTPITFSTFYTAMVRERLGSAEVVGSPMSLIGFEVTVPILATAVVMATAIYFSDKLNVGTAGAVGTPSSLLGIAITGNPYFNIAEFGTFQAVENNPRFTYTEAYT